ncbi:MAG TPA: hypothetical protein VN374_04900, partial [Desulfitobacteriaceae bacterium]|nr:hypothetical protein [Desulfitobacteriaceae bacterium]
MKKEEIKREYSNNSENTTKILKYGVSRALTITANCSKVKTSSKEFLRRKIFRAGNGNGTLQLNLKSVN